MINIYIILALSTNLLVGMTNLLSLGQAAFYGIGAYATVFALIVLKLPLIPALLFVMIACAIISLIIALPSIRLKGDYFVLATLGFQLIVFSILYNCVSITKGPYGISGIPSPKLLGFIEISGIIPFFIFSSICVAAFIFLFFKLVHSPFGRVLKAIREDEVSTLALGRNVTYFKIIVFVISSAFIAVAGLIYATYVSYIDPTSFNLDESIFILSAVLIGGIGNIKGPVIGAIFVVALPEILRFVGLPDSVAANTRQIIYGLALVVLMRFRPHGFLGERIIK